METLKEKALEYKNYNDKKKKFDKMRKNVRNEIINELKERGIEKFEDEDIKVNKVTQTRKKFDDEKLLEVIEKHNLNAVKKSPDKEKLENLLESGELDQTIIEEISECVNVSEYSYVKVKEDT